MKKLALLLSLIASTCFAQVDATWDYDYFTGASNAVRRVDITPVTWGVNNGRFITPDRLRYTNDGTGSLTVSNMATNFAYKVEFYGPFTTLAFTNYFPPGTTGAVNAANYLTATNFSGAGSGYTMAQADARFVRGVAQGTNGILTVTNSGVVTVHFTGSSGGGGGTTYTNGPGLPGVISGSSIGTNLTSLATVAGLTTVSNLFYPTNVVTPELYGARPGLKAVYDVYMTNGATIIYAPSAPFTSDDIGKTAVLYQDATNASFVLSGVASVLSSSRIQLSNAATVTWSSPSAVRYNALTNSQPNLYFTNLGELHLFHDCTPAFQAMLDANTNGAVVELQNQPYGFSSPPVQRAAGYLENSVVRIPQTGQRPIENAGYSITDPPKKATFYFKGAMRPSDFGQSGSFSRASWAGTILYCVTRPVSNGNRNAFFGNSAANPPGDHGNNNAVFSGLTFRQPWQRQVWDVYAHSGGGYVFDDCAFDVPYRAGMGGLYGSGPSGEWIPKNPSTNSVQAGGVWLSHVNNNSAFYFHRVDFYYLPVALIAGEMTRIDNTRFWNCNQALYLQSQAIMWADKCDFVNNVSYIDAYPGDGGPFPISFTGIKLEDHFNLTNIYLNLPTNSVKGVFEWANDALNFPVSRYPFVTFRQLGNNIVGAQESISTHGLSVRGPLYSELGGSGENANVIFDVNFTIEKWHEKPGDDLYFGSRPFADYGIFATPPESIPYAPSPAGLGVHLYGTGSIGFSRINTNENTTCSELGTNFTVSAFFRATNNVLTTIFVKNSTNNYNAAWLYIGNGTQVGFKVNDINSNNVAATYNTTLGLADGVWHHIVGTYNSGAMQLYVDGEYRATNFVTTAPMPPSGTMMLGSGNGEMLAHPKAWARVLSAAEIANLARSRGLYYDGSSLTNIRTASLYSTNHSSTNWSTVETSASDSLPLIVRWGGNNVFQVEDDATTTIGPGGVGILYANGGGLQNVPFDSLTGTRTLALNMTGTNRITSATATNEQRAALIKLTQALQTNELGPRSITLTGPSNWLSAGGVVATNDTIFVGGGGVRPPSGQNLSLGGGGSGVKPEVNLVNAFAGNLDFFTTAQPAGTLHFWNGRFYRDVSVSSNLTAGTITATNGYYYPSNSFSAANVAAGMTNGGFWQGTISNSLMCAWMSNNVVNWKQIAP